MIYAFYGFKVADVYRKHLDVVSAAFTPRSIFYEMATRSLSRGFVLTER